MRHAAVRLFLYCRPFIPPTVRAEAERISDEAKAKEHLRTGVELCRLLDIPSRSDLDAFLKRHGVPLEYTIEEFEREGTISARLWDKARAELGQS